jgi:hypothetical protein
MLFQQAAAAEIGLPAAHAKRFRRAIDRNKRPVVVAENDHRATS